MSKKPDKKAAIESLKTAYDLREKRLSKGTKLSWMAGQMGITPAFLSLLENGKRLWNEELKAKFLKAIGN